MDVPLTTPEGLYELVSTLQQEQQGTQLELRAIQQRGGPLRDAVRAYQASIAEHREERQLFVAKLVVLRPLVRLQQAQGEGALCAVREAVKELCVEQNEILDAFHRRAAPTAAPTANGVLAGQSSHGASFEGLPAPMGEELTETALHHARDTTIDRETALAASCSPLYSGAATHALLTSVLEKLSASLTAMEAAAAASESDAAEAAHKAAPPVEPTAFPIEALSDQHGVASVGVEATALPIAAVGEFPTRVGTDGLPHKKHIEFAADASMHHITPVPGLNVNRSSPSFASFTRLTKRGTPTSSAPRTRYTVHAATTSDPPRGTAKFTVRVASRSSTLLAEAAALGAKRQRSLHAAAHTKTAAVLPLVRTGATEEVPALEPVQGIPPPLSVRRLEERFPACNSGHAGASVSAPAMCGVNASTFANEAEHSAAGSRVSGGGAGAGAGPRRTVWVWSQESTPRKKQ